MEPHQKRKLVSIAPALGEDGELAPAQNGRLNSGSATPTIRPKRVTTLVACEGCRRKRIKCDGQRPRCGQCDRKGNECAYALAVGETILLSLKKKNRALEGENKRCVELLTLLCTKPEYEANEILRRIRNTDKPFLVFDEIKHAQLLLVEPSSTVESASADERQGRLDRDALAASVIKVPARPWTVVADDGLVSELVSAYFTWENAYLLPAVDRDAFVLDMRARDASSARWCSPLLVNAMCAHKSQVVERARLFGAMKTQDLTLCFLNEAKRLLDDEQGRASIPTAQALMLMFLTTMCLGRDRTGHVYRLNAIDMTRRLNIEAKYVTLRDDRYSQTREKRLLARALWGLFIFESRVAFVYFQPSQIPLPKIPHPFTDGYSRPQPSGNVDVLGLPFDDSPYAIPHVPGINAAACALSELFWEVMMNNTREGTARVADVDLRIQKAFYSRLKLLIRSWPRQFYLENNITPETCFLRLHENEVGFGIIQTLRHGALFETPASQPGKTIRELCLEYCCSDSRTIEAYMARRWPCWPFDSLLWRHLYLSMQPLMLMLDSPVAVSLFTKNCVMLRQGCHTYRVCGFLLQALQAIAWAIGQPIPESALPHLQGWTRDEAESGDSLVSFALPQHNDVKVLLAAVSADIYNEVDQLGSLLKRWALK